MHIHMTMRFDGAEPTSLWQGEDENLAGTIWDSIYAGMILTGCTLIEDVAAEAFAWRIWRTPMGATVSHTAWKCDSPYLSEIASLN